MKTIKLEINYNDETGIIPNPFASLMETIAEIRLLGFSVKIVFENDVLPGDLLTSKQVKQTVYTFFGVKADIVESPTRRREICQIRQTAHYCAKELTKDSLSVIGAEIGGKNHATVTYSLKAIQNLMITNKKFKSTMDVLMDMF